VSLNKLKDIAHVYMGVSPRDLKPGKGRAAGANAASKQTKGQRECWAVSLACLDHEKGLLIPEKMERATIKETLLHERSEQRPNYNLDINDILISNRGNYRVVGPIASEQRYGVKDDPSMAWVPSMTIVLIRMRKEYRDHAERLAWFLGSERTRRALFDNLRPAKNGQLVLTKDKLEELDLPDRFLDFDSRYFSGARGRMNEALQLRRRIADMRADRTTKAMWRNLECPASYEFDSKDDALPAALGCTGDVSPDTIVRLYDDAGKLPPTFTEGFLQWAKPYLKGKKLLEAMGPGHYISRKLAIAADVQALGLDQACPSIVRLLAGIAKHCAHVGMLGEVSGELLSTLAQQSRRDGEMTDLSIWSSETGQMQVATERVRFSNPGVRIKAAAKPELYLSENSETDYYHAVYALLSDSSACDINRPMEGLNWQDALNLVRKNGMLIVLGAPEDIWGVGLKSNSPLAQHLETLIQLPGALFGSRITQKTLAIFRHSPPKGVVRIINATGASAPGEAELLTEAVRSDILLQLNQKGSVYAEVAASRSKIQGYPEWPGVHELMGQAADLTPYTVESIGEELRWLEGRLEKLKQEEDKAAARVIPPEIVTPRPVKPTGWK
jgi:hypothetical protein